MIYKNFYNKYKMSEPNSPQIEEDKMKDIDELKEQGNVLIDDNNIVKESSEELEGIEDIGEEIITNKKSNKEILLELGDVILISEPDNEILNNNTFLIEYIDSKKVKLINSETFEKIVLQISSDGIIGDGNIESIKIISRNPEKGYAKIGRAHV